MINILRNKNKYIKIDIHFYFHLFLLYEKILKICYATGYYFKTPDWLNILRYLLQNIISKVCVFQHGL